MTSTMKDHMLSNTAYDRLKNVALVVLPATGALYAGLAQIWGLPAGEEVVASIVVVDTFLGVVIKIGDASYNASSSKYDGAVIVSEDEEKQTFSLVLNADPSEIAKNNELRFKVTTKS